MIEGSIRMPALCTHKLADTYSRTISDTAPCSGFRPGTITTFTLSQAYSSAAIYLFAYLFLYKNKRFYYSSFLSERFFSFHVSDHQTNSERNNVNK